MKIKICGLRDPGNILAVAGLNPDYVGFICYDQSPRFINGLSPEVLPGILAKKTGVFVNSSFSKMVNMIEAYQFDAVQLHGSESPGICHALKYNRPIIETKISTVVKGRREAKKSGNNILSTITLLRNVEVIKAFGIDENFDFDQLDAYARSVDYFLFDTKTSQHGGSGKSFDWALLNNYQLGIPFFLSGGISLDNLDELRKIKHPGFYGVDLNSRFEIAPGIKDVGKLKLAFARLNNVNNEIRS